MRAGRVVGVVGLVALVGFAGAVWVHNRYASYESRVVAWPAVEVGDVAPRTWQPKQPGTIRILSLDGGGIRGLITLEVLKYLEDKSGKPISELFDVIAGTSTGAIIASLLAMADDDGKPKYRVEDIIDLYDDLVKRVFVAPWYHRLLTLWGWLGPAYSNEARFALADEVYRDTNFRDLLLPVMIPTYSVERAGLHIFNNWSPDLANIYLGSVVAAATSAPTIFPAVELRGLPSANGIYMDAGILNLDPAREVFLSALEEFPEAKTVMVSVGTGIPQSGINPWISMRGGLLAWLPPLISAATDGHIRRVSTWLERYSKTRFGQHLRYYRFDTLLPESTARFDDTSTENIQYLTSRGKALVLRDKQKLDDAIRHLLLPATD